MTSLPGHVGAPVFGDCSKEFYNDMMQFVSKRLLKYNSAVFSARFLNTPTVFVTSHTGVKQLLNDQHDKVDLGYKAFMHHIYGDNILFTNGPQVNELRTVLKSLLTSSDSTQHFHQVIKRLTLKHLGTVENGKPFGMYKFFKNLATEISLSIFLDANFDGSEELHNHIVSLTTRQWHGVTSIPVCFRLGSSKSAYCKASEAKKELLSILHSKLSQHSTLFSEKVEDGSFSNAQTAANHLMLFISTLVPKCLASLLTSFLLITSDNSEMQLSFTSDPDMLHGTLCEVLRMWPPLFGGRRIAKQDFDLCGYHIPADYAVVYLTHHAQHDESVFSDPDVFKPERWADSKHDMNDLFILGNGPRDCIGRHLVLDMVKLVIQEISKQFIWQLQNPEDNIQYKWFPVLRPKHEVKIIFQSRT